MRKMEQTVQVPVVLEKTGIVDRKAVRQRKRQGGFTLIEMMAVLVIMLIVAGVGIYFVNRQIETARERTDVTNMKQVADQGVTYILDHPSTTANTDITSDLQISTITDPWGDATPYTVTYDGTNIVVKNSKHGYSYDIPETQGYSVTSGSTPTLTEPVSK